MDFDVVGRGLSGEVAQGAADRMKHEVEKTKPDLVIWELGTNDALRHVSLDKFKASLKATLAWRPRATHCRLGMRSATPAGDLQSGLVGALDGHIKPD
jgi:lysophospholipase L1-like esterase